MIDGGLVHIAATARPPVAVSGTFRRDYWYTGSPPPTAEIRQAAINDFYAEVQPYAREAAREQYDGTVDMTGEVIARMRAGRMDV